MLPYRAKQKLINSTNIQVGTRPQFAIYIVIGRFNSVKMKTLIIVIICVCLYFMILPIVFGIYSGCRGEKYIYRKEKKKELLESHLNLIKQGYIIQGFPYNGWSVSYYPKTDRTWFYPKMFDYFYKWSVYYNFKWLDRC